MTTYCAFLRGINVNGVKMDMASLAGAFHKMGLINAVTVLGTGNVVFGAQSKPKMLKMLIEHGLSDRFSYDAHVFLRSVNQLTDLIGRANLHPAPAGYHQYYLLCDDLNTIIDLSHRFKSMAHSGNEMLLPLDSGMIWQVPKGETLISELGREALGKAYVTLLTSRNMNTVMKVYERMQRLDA